MKGCSLALMLALLLAGMLMPAYRANEQDAYALTGDVNGDGTVDMLDISIAIDSFLFSLGMPNWNPNADINNDKTIDMADISIAIDHFMQT